jgi:hypothetical protein
VRLVAVEPSHAEEFHRRRRAPGGRQGVASRLRLGAVAGAGAAEAGRHKRGSAGAASAPPATTPWPQERGVVRSRRR